MNDQEVIGLWHSIQKRVRENITFNWSLAISFLALVLSTLALVRKPAAPAPPTDYSLYNSCLSAQKVKPLTFAEWKHNVNSDPSIRFCGELAHVH